MWEYVILLGGVIVLVYFIYKYFQSRDEDRVVEATYQHSIDTNLWGTERWIPPQSAEERKAHRFSKPMKPFYFGKKEEEQHQLPQLDVVGSCVICHTDLNVISKMVCIKCLKPFCSKHFKKHKCRPVKYPHYRMGRKEYADGTTVYYPDRREPITRKG